MAARPAAIAAAAAEALPPPGVAVGAASCSTKGSTPARRPPTAVFPPMTDARRFSRINEESKFSTCRNHSAACSRIALLGNQSDNFARGRTGRDAVTGCFTLDHFKDAVDGRLFKVGKVHRNLRLTAYQEACAFYEAHSAVGEAHGFRNFLGNVDVGSAEEDVIRNQKLARSHHGGACRGMDARVTKIRAARGIRGDLCADAFELPAANVLEALSFRSSGGGFIQIDGNLKALPDLLADVVCHGHAVFDGDAVNRNKRNDVGSSHARMRAGVSVEVNELGGFAHAANGSFLNGLAIAD